MAWMAESCIVAIVCPLVMELLVVNFVSAAVVLSLSPNMLYIF